MKQRIRLLLVDPQTLFRRCLAAVLSRRRSLDIVGEAGSGAEALSLASSLQPDLVILDPAVPEGGTELITALSENPADPAVVVLAAGSGAIEAGRALQAGARGYLDKDCQPVDVLHVIERVHAGELVVAPGSASGLFRQAGLTDEVAPDLGRLTAREIEVVHLVVQGRTNAEIARELHITEHTAKAHVARIRAKLALENRVQLTAYAVQRGIGEHSEGTTVADPAVG